MYWQIRFFEIRAYLNSGLAGRSRSAFAAVASATGPGGGIIPSRSAATSRSKASPRPALPGMRMHNAEMPIPRKTKKK